MKVKMLVIFCFLMIGINQVYSQTYIKNANSCNLASTDLTHDATVFQNTLNSLSARHSE